MQIMIIPIKIIKEVIAVFCLLFVIALNA
jgi:hypothetical protein